MPNEKELMARISEIPPIVPSLLRLTEVISSGNYAVDDVHQIIQFDHALTADTLRYANSVSSGSRREIVSVLEAVIRMGGERLHEFLMERWLGRQIRQPLETYGMQDMDLWKHSVHVAVGTAHLDVHLGGKVGPASYTAGILHDLGKVVLNCLASHLRLQVCWSGAKLSSAELMELEREFLGITHGEAGGCLLQHWGIPRQLVDAVTWHHFPERDNFLGRLIGAADLLAHYGGEVDPKLLLWEQLEISPQEIISLDRDIRLRTNKILQPYGESI